MSNLEQNNSLIAKIDSDDTKESVVKQAENYIKSFLAQKPDIKAVNVATTVVSTEFTIHVNNANSVENNYAEHIKKYLENEFDIHNPTLVFKELNH